MAGSLKGSETLEDDRDSGCRMRDLLCVYRTRSSDMPALIYPIDAIARQKRRDVLMLSFCPPDEAGRPIQGLRGLSRVSWEKCAPYQEMLQWLEAEGIAYERCLPVLGDEVIEMAWIGNLYVDLVLDEEDVHYRRLQSKLGHSDGMPRSAHIKLHCITLKHAMKWALQDDRIPGEDW